MNIQNKSASIGMKLFVVFSFAMLILSSVGVFALNISGTPSVSSFRNGQVPVPFGGENSLAKGLVGYYKLDDADTGYAINEVGLDAINLGATTGVYGIVNTGFDFYYSPSGHVDTSTDIGAEASVSLWIQPYSNSDVFGTISGVTSRDGYHATYENGNLYIYYLQNDNYVNMIGVDISSEVASFVGVHVIFVVDQNNDAIVYINGNLASTFLYNWNTVPSVHDGSLNLGAERDNSNHGFNGRMDEVGVWDRALSVSEVSKLYNNHLGLAY